MLFIIKKKKGDVFTTKQSIKFIGFKEKWKTIKICGEKTKYQVSNLGRVRNHKKHDKLLTFIDDMYGYTQVCLSHKNKKYVKTVHRLVAESFIPNPKELPQVNHKDGRKYNNSVFNLEWVTAKENVIHAYTSGLHENVAKGENHGMNKYSEKTIHHLCHLLEENKLTLQELSDNTGVSLSTIHDILAHKYWLDISSLYKIDNYNIKKYKGISQELKNKIIDAAKKFDNTHDVRIYLGIKYDDRINAIISYYVKKYKKEQGSTTIER